MERYELIAPCHFGLEAVLKKEVVDLGYEVTEVENGRVTFIGDAEAICHAAALAIKSLLGLVCDPIAGLVEVPCIKRNASGVAGAFVAAEMALAGIDSAIPADEVIWSMKRIGDVMSPTLKETAEGGLAATPTGRKLHDQVFGPGNVSGGCSGCSGCHS